MTAAPPPGPGARQMLVPHRIGVEAPPAGQVVALDGMTMGTTWSVRVVAPPDLDRAALQQRLKAELDDLVQQMSHWEPGSVLSRFNRSAAGTWWTLPPAFFEVLQFARGVAAASGGAFDPSAGALVDLWGFGAHDGNRPPFQMPAAEAVEQARARVGWQRLALLPASRQALQPGGLRLDLSAVAKGYAVDRLALRLDRHGLRHHLVEVGGELRGSGVKPDGQPWWVQVEAPPGLADGPEALLALHGAAVATSGDYRRVIEHQGRRLPHSIDPRSGWPITHGVASVSVWHCSAMAADAWSTALTVLGPEDGLACATREGLAARFVCRSGASFELLCSPAWLALTR